MKREDIEECRRWVKEGINTQEWAAEESSRYTRLIDDVCNAALFAESVCSSSRQRSTSAARAASMVRGMSPPFMKGHPGHQIEDLRVRLGTLSQQLRGENTAADFAAQLAAVRSYEALHWAATWIETSGQHDEAVRSFAKNMAMTIRAEANSRHPYVGEKSHG